MDEKQIKLNKIGRGISSSLIHTGVNIGRSATDFKKSVYTAQQIIDFLGQELGLKELLKNVSRYDYNHYLTSFDNWKEVIALDVTRTIKYNPEFMDCDNFAFAFASIAALLYGLNSAPPTQGPIYRKDTGAYIGGHLFNILITEDDGILHAHLYEPIIAKYCLIEKGKTLIVGAWKYIPNWLNLF
jgi:hypothetical protein